MIIQPLTHRALSLKNKLRTNYPSTGKPQCPAHQSDRYYLNVEQVVYMYNIYIQRRALQERNWALENGKETVIDDVLVEQ